MLLETTLEELLGVDGFELSKKKVVGLLALGYDFIDVGERVVYLAGR